MDILWHPIRAIKLRIRLRKIEKAIGYKMHKWQRKFVLDPDWRALAMPGGRANGKTIAACVWVLLHRKYPLNIRQSLITSMRTYDKKDFPIPDPDADLNIRAAQNTLRTLKELHEKCKEKGIKVFDLC